MLAVRGREVRRSWHAWRGFGIRPPGLARGGCSVPSAFGAAETRLAFLLRRAVGVTAAAWQSRERRRGVAALTARFSPTFLYHLPSVTAHDLFTQQQAAALRTGDGLEGAAFPYRRLSVLTFQPQTPFVQPQSFS